MRITAQDRSINNLIIIGRWEGAFPARRAACRVPRAVRASKRAFSLRYCLYARLLGAGSIHWRKKTPDGCWIHKNQVQKKKTLVWNGFFIAWIIGPVTLQRVTPVPVRVWWCGARVWWCVARVCVHKARGELGPRADGRSRDRRIQTMLTMFSK